MFWGWGQGDTDIWDWVKGAALVLGGAVMHAGAVLWRGGEKSNQFKVFGEDIKEIKQKVDKIPGLEGEMRAIRQALFDHGIEVRNGGH